MKIKSTRLTLPLAYCLLLLSLCLKILPIETDATSTFFQQNEMWVTGTLRYVNSSWGYPSDNLNGETHKIYFSAEAERSLLKDPYLSNASQTTLKAYLDNNMSCQIPFGGRLEVTQSHYSSSSNKTATAYYDVVVNDMQTNILYRPTRNDNYITYISIGLILFGCITVIKVLRND